MTINNILHPIADVDCSYITTKKEGRASADVQHTVIIEEQILSTYIDTSENELVSHWSVIGQLYVSHWSVIGQSQVTHWSAVCQSLVSCMSVTGQLYINHWSVTGHLYVTHWSVTGQSVVSYCTVSVMSSVRCRAMTEMMTVNSWRLIVVDCSSLTCMIADTHASTCCCTCLYSSISHHAINHSPLGSQSQTSVFMRN